MLYRRSKTTALRADASAASPTRRLANVSGGDSDKTRRSSVIRELRDVQVRMREMLDGIPHAGDVEFVPKDSSGSQLEMKSTPSTLSFGDTSMPVRSSSGRRDLRWCRKSPRPQPERPAPFEPMGLRDRVCYFVEQPRIGMLKHRLPPRERSRRRIRLSNKAPVAASSGIHEARRPDEWQYSGYSLRKSGTLRRNLIAR